MHMQTKRNAFFTAVLSLILALALLFTGTAYAKSASFVGNWEDTGETSVYLSDMTVDNLQYTIHDKRVKLLHDTGWPGGSFSYTGALADGQTIQLDHAVTLTFKNAGVTVDGRSIDATFDFSVNLTGTSSNTSGLEGFLGVFCSGNRIWEYTCQRGTYTEVNTDAAFTYSDTGQPFEDGFQLCISDLDVVCKSNPAYSESMRLTHGFGDTVYVAEDTKLDRAELSSSGGTHFVATESDDNSFLSGFAAVTDSGNFGFSWRGSGGCGTMLKVYYPNYPASAVGEPSKAAVQDTVEWGDEVSFAESQTFPYVVDSNKASSISLTDTLDPALDAAAVSVKVTAGGKDVSSNWNVSVEGQQLTVTAKDTGKVQGEHQFTVSAPVCSDADFSGYKVQGGYCLIPNQASLDVNGVQQTTNTASVGVTYGTVEVFKSSTNPSLTDGNACYTLEGAEYTVYRDEACSDLVDSFTTGKDGHGVSYINQE